jgi:hypothetical protein
MSLALTTLPSKSNSQIHAILNRTEKGGSSTPCLFLGNADAAKDSELLKSLGVTHVVTAAFGNPDPTDDVGQLFPSDFIYHEVKIPDNSEFDLSPYFAPCADFIHSALSLNSDSPEISVMESDHATTEAPPLELRTILSCSECSKGDARFAAYKADSLSAPAVDPLPHRVFIHCMVGTSRSASLLLYYMMRYRHYSLRNALLHVMHQRSSDPDAPYTHPNRGFMRQLIACERGMSLGGVTLLTLNCYMTEFSTGKNISRGPIPEPKPAKQHKQQRLSAHVSQSVLD